MSDIGYAVFGRPRGLKTIANGLFSDLGIESTLYLSDADVVLQPGEQVLLIKRIPTDLGNLEKRDGIMVALYEHAYQHLENRAGGFVGSAICFKTFNPNSERLITGLYALFFKIKKQVDENGRFKRSDSTEWNIELPDASKDYGFLTTNHLLYRPLKKVVNKLILPVQDIEQYTKGALDSSAINWSFHTVKNMYITDQKSVVETMQSKGGSTFEYDALFNYGDQFRTIQSEITAKQNEVSSASRELETLKRDARGKQNEIEQLKSSMAGLQQQYESLQEKAAHQEKESKRIKSEYDNWETEKRTHQNNIAELKREKSQLERSVHQLKKEEKRFKDNKKNQYNRNANKERKLAEDHTENKGFAVKKSKDDPEIKKTKLNMPLVIMTGVALLMTILVVYFIIDGMIGEAEKNEMDSNITTMSEASTPDSPVFKKLWEIDSTMSAEDVYEHNLTLLMGLNSSQIDSIRKYPSSCYDKYPGGSPVISFLNNRYLIPVEEGEIGTDSLELSKASSESGGLIPALFKLYNDSFPTQSIYTKIPKDRLKDSVVLHNHFEWMIRVNNADEWNNQAKIQIPIIN